MHASAHFPTDQPGRYLAQICKHFAHKLPVDWSDTEGVCRFVCGTARLAVTETGLALSVTAPSEAELLETQDVIERHLLRFAFRDGAEVLTWGR